MAGTVITDLSFFTGATGGSTSDCDDITDWDTAPTLDTESFIQGTGACSAKVSKTTFTSVFTFSVAVNLTNKLIYVWMLSATPAGLAAKSSGGFRIRVEDSLGNWGEWYVAGSDTYFGGWECFAVHTGETFSNKSATAPIISDITKAGVVCYNIGSSAKTNFYFDAMRYGTGLTIYAGTSGEPAVFADFMTAENDINKKYGVVQELAGIYLVQGKLKFGSLTAGQTTYFKDTTVKIIVFRKRIMPTTFYEIVLQGNATGTTEIYFGDKQGGAGVAGPIFRCEDITIPYKVTATDTNVTKFGFWGCSFYNAGVISGQAYNIDKEFLSCTFFKCSQMEPNTGIVKDCSFLSTTGKAILMNSTSHKISDSKFINCQTAVHINFSAAVDFDNLNFYGNDPYDIEHSVAGTLTINYSADTVAPPSEAKVNETGGGNTVIQTSVTLTVRHVKTGSEPTEYVRCYIRMKESPYTEIMNKDAMETDDLNPGYYKATRSYTVTGIVVIVRAREKGYLPFEIEMTIPSGGLDVTAVWLEDPNYQV